MSDIVEGIEWCITNEIHVINMSLSTSSDVVALEDAVNEAANAGIIIVAAAGNSGGTVQYPAAYDAVIAVSATDQNDEIASWSSRGPQVELAAPGVSIYSTYKGGGYATMSGTSMASPHVAGVAALILETADSDTDVRATLQSWADVLGDLGRDQLYGFGLVDAYPVD